MVQKCVLFIKTHSGVQAYKLQHKIRMHFAVTMSTFKLCFTGGLTRRYMQ